MSSGLKTDDGEELSRADLIARIIDPVSFEKVRQGGQLDDAEWRCNRARDKAAHIETLFDTRAPSDALQKGPKFALGEWVWHDVTAEVAAGVSISQPVKLCIVAVYMGSYADGRVWTYALSADPPDAYHYGSGVQFNSVAEAKLRPSVEAKP